MKIHLSTLILLLAVAFPLKAQQIGSWQGTVLCEQCPEPYGMTFADKSSGLIITKSVVQGVEKKTTAFRTNDEGKNWVLLSDSNTLSGHYGSSLAMQYFLPDFAVDVTSGYARFTTNNGTSWRNHSGYLLNGECAIIIDHSTYFVFGDDVSSHATGNILVTRDTGNSYNFFGDGLILSSDVIWTACMPDTTDVWVTTSGRPREHLHHTTDGGFSWNEVYPVDTSKPGGVFLGTLLCGAIKGTIYLYSNSSNFTATGYKTPDQRILSLIYTTDKGKTWDADTSNHTKFVLLQNSGGEKLWGIVYGTRTIAYSPDNAKSWAYDSLTFTDEPIWLMYWKDTTLGYILTYKDKTTKIYRWMPPENTVEAGAVFTIQDLKLYPVVASRSIKLIPRIPIRGTMEIYDILGRLYGSHNVEWPAKLPQEVAVDKLSSGVYLLIVRKPGDVNSIRFIKE